MYIRYWSIALSSPFTFPPPRISICYDTVYHANTFNRYFTPQHHHSITLCIVFIMSLLTAFDELTVQDYPERLSEHDKHVERTTSKSPDQKQEVDTHVRFSLTNETKEDHFVEMYHARIHRRHRREADDDIDMRISLVTSAVEVNRWSLCPLSLAKHTESLAPGTLSTHKSACRGRPDTCLSMAKRRQQKRSALTSL